MATPELTLKYKTIKNMSIGTVLLNIGIIIYIFKLFSMAIHIRFTIGYYINMVTQNDGNVLPILLAMPGILSLPLNVTSVYLLYKVFSSKKRPNINTLMFVLVLVSIASLCIMIIMCIMVLTHAYGTDETLHDGITDAMKNYSSNSNIKRQIDLLQMEFQCCGSKEYKEWYSINWYDSNLVKNQNDTHQTPFSCCAMASMFHCIHHGIESNNLIYHYSYDLNFSITTTGCFGAIKKTKKSVGWGIIGKICLLILLQVVVTIGLRLVQTAHSVESRFNGDKTYYTWLVGSNTHTEPGQIPPPVPSIPSELKT